MAAFLLVWRLFLLLIAGYWIVAIAIAARKPSDWQPPRAAAFPLFKVTRDRFILGGVGGIVVCLALIVVSLVVPDFP